ncbi:MAG: hypothetical protein K0Q99_1307 [Clostridia bacterium]|jgi:hypothetical protein|nr:hypothetical protein [Clostridia bacterium]
MDNKFLLYKNTYEPLDKLMLFSLGGVVWQEKLEKD